MAFLQKRCITFTLHVYDLTDVSGGGRDGVGVSRMRPQGVKPCLQLQKADVSDEKSGHFQTYLWEKMYVLEAEMCIFPSQVVFVPKPNQIINTGDLIEHVILRSTKLPHNEM